MAEILLSKSFPLGILPYTGPGRLFMGVSLASCGCSPAGGSAWVPAPPAGRNGENKQKRLVFFCKLSSFALLHVCMFFDIFFFKPCVLMD